MFFSNSMLRRPGIRILAAFTFLFVTFGLVSCQSPPKTAVEVLKGSMAKYAELQTFQADCNWSATYDNQPTDTASKRNLWYARPNRFKVVSTHNPTGMAQTSVSDGTKLVEFATGIPMPAQSYDAPPSIAEASSMQMGHPMFCGSLLYKFFGGPDKYSALVDETKMPVSFGPPVTLDGQECKTVRFWAQGNYGKTEVAIGVKDGLVHRIQYGSEPLMQIMQSDSSKAELQRMLQSPEYKKQLAEAGKPNDAKAIQDALDKLKNMPTTSLTTETYTQIVVGKPIAAEVFAAKAPEGQQVQEAGGGAEPQPPVALGQPAPEISVTGMDGVKHKLADFKGKVVLMDFWATWCGPCRKGLPETQKFFTEYGNKGLEVLTISDEEKSTVQPFIQQNQFTFPVYLDSGDETNKAYNIAAIPTVVILDKNGNLVAYKVGLSPPEDILAALKKAGLETP